MSKKTLFLMLMIIVLVTLSFSQKKNEKPVISEDNTAACEGNSVYFDIISGEVKNNKERIFVIFSRWKRRNRNR